MKSGLSESPNKSPPPTNFLVKKPSPITLWQPLFSPHHFWYHAPSPISFWQSTSLFLITFCHFLAYHIAIAIWQTTPSSHHLFANPLPHHFWSLPSSPWVFGKKPPPFWSLLVTFWWSTFLNTLWQTTPFSHHLFANPLLPSLLIQPPTPDSFSSHLVKPSPFTFGSDPLPH